MIRLGSALLTAVCLTVLAGMWSQEARAQATLDFNSPDSIRMTLDAQMKKRVRVKLVSGQDVEGTVSQVGTHAVLFTELAGQEFYDATVRLDQIAAIVVRRAGR